MFVMKGEDANLIVSAESIPDTIYLKGKTKEQIYNEVFETKDYKQFLQEKLIIAGKEVAIFKYLPNLEISQILSVTITEKIVWVAVCSAHKNCTLDDMKDFQIIVRSLRILK